MKIPTHIKETIDRQLKELKQKELVDIITRYDFIVGSIECKHQLMKILPEGANILCSLYIEDRTKVYVFKKFDIMDLLKEP